MFRKIENIKNLGTYSNFSWNSQFCDIFKRYNFIYGWNYSGKTTLSRLFHCLEIKKPHPDYPHLQFTIETNNGKLTERNIENNNFSIRVFNEEFVEDNFKWNDANHRVNPVLILGKESIELQKKISEKEKEIKEKKEEEKKIEEEKKRLKNEFDRSLTSKASEIRKILSITNQREFDKISLENKINSFIDNYKEYILNDKDLETKLNTYRNEREYKTIDKIIVHLKLNELTNRINNLLNKKISVQQVIQKLRDNPKLNNWVREGIDLHKNEKQCQFCGNNLPADLFDRLNKHFSKEFNELIDEINLLEKEINEYKNNLQKIELPDEARFYEAFHHNYRIKKEELKKCIESIKEEKVNYLLKKLKEKRNKPFEVIDKVSLGNSEDEIDRVMKEVNNLINQNNQKIQGLSEEKNKIKQKLLNHYSALAIQELDYLNKKIEIENLTKLTNKNKELELITGEIDKFKNEIIRSNIGADKINKYLKTFFSDDQLYLKALNDGTYQIYRNENIAKNLSTGEKNIIALIYFITKLEETSFNINDSIIFIDDPVSSLDTNHTFKVYVFLSEKVLNCRQLFITTHNFDFFNLIKDLVKSDPVGTINRQTKEQKENFYLIKKVCINNQRCSIIENLPVILKKFKSEYNYLFSILKDFKGSEDKSNFELLYLLPNIARRFIEAYLFYKYPDGKKFKDKCNKFFTNCEETIKKSTLKVLDEYSHEENPEHIQKFPDINEVESCVITILTLLKDKDREHYDALCESLIN